MEFYWEKMAAGQGFSFSRHISFHLSVIIPEMVHIQVCDEYDDLECYCSLPHVNHHLWPQRVRKLFCTSFLGMLAKVAKRTY